MLGLQDLVVSALAGVEVPAAIWRKARGLTLTLANAELAARQFEIDFHGTASNPPQFDVLSVSTGILTRAALLVLRRRNQRRLSGRSVTNRTNGVIRHRQDAVG